MLPAFAAAFVRYHRGLGKMPLAWKPWLASLLIANMIAPLAFLGRLEARVVFIVALINGAIFVALTAYSGFSRLLGLGHLPWIPLIYFLATRLSEIPADTPYGWWIRCVILLNAGSLLLDTANVVRYAAGDRKEMVADLENVAAKS